MDKLEFERRVMAYRNKSYHIAKAILACEADCDDAMQEAMVNAWLNLSRLRTQDYFETWFCRILINECKKILRYHARHPEIAMNESIPEPVPPDPGLWTALRSLDARYRIPLVLHHVEGNTIKEIAEVLRLPASTVKWRIHQGKSLLHSQLRKEEAL